MASTKIAMVGIGQFSHANQSLLGALRHAFPSHQIDWIDLVPLVERSAIPALINSASTLREFRKQLILHPNRFVKKWHWTNYLFDKRSSVAQKRITQGNYQFSIQTQSLFDASVPGTPHFVYTDNTMLANLQYASTKRGDLPVSDGWIAREHRMYHRARICFVMSKNVARSLVEDYACPADKIVCAYAGHNCNTVQGSHKQLDQRNIVFVGVNWERKGGPALLQAFRIVRKHVPDATLTIVGCSPKLDEPGCRVVGRVPLAEVADFYLRASVFCLPTLCEPFGLVFPEAMAHGLPVVGTNVGAIPDFILDGENGYRVAPGDVEGLSVVLVKLLQDPASCRRMGERGRVISQIYQWENVASIMRRTIENTISSISPEVAESSLLQGVTAQS